MLDEAAGAAEEHAGRATDADLERATGIEIDGAVGAP